MNATVLIILAAIGMIIAFLIFFKGKRHFLGAIVAIMSVMVFIVGFNGYQEIKKDAFIYQPLAVQWLEDKNNRDKALVNYSFYCIYYSPDQSRAVVYVELPSSADDLVMVYSRKNKSIEEIHSMPKNKKPEPNFQNKLDPAIYFY